MLSAGRHVVADLLDLVDEGASAIAFALSDLRGAGSGAPRPERRLERRDPSPGASSGPLRASASDIAALRR